jgi:hypothetical protein
VWPAGSIGCGRAAEHRSGRVGVGWVMVWCPRQYDELMRQTGGVWEPGARQWLIERRRIGSVIRELERTVGPLFRRVGIHLERIRALSGAKAASVYRLVSGGQRGALGETVS